MLSGRLSRVAGSLLSGLRHVHISCNQAASGALYGRLLPSGSSPVLPGIRSSAPFSSLIPGAGTFGRVLPSPPPTTVIPCRTFIKMRRTDGKKQAEERVVMRYFRLPWGGWIKRTAGCHKRVWKMSPSVRSRRDQHVFVSRHFSQMFDRMVTKKYREEKYYVDDIYAPYQQRHGMLHPYYKPKIVLRHERIAFPDMTQSALANRKALETPS